MRTIAVAAVLAALVLSIGVPLAASPQPRLTLPGIPNPKLADEPPEIGKHGGTFVVSVISDPRTFNPIVVQDGSSSAVTGLIFDSLIEQNYLTGEIEPALAESWAVAPDGRTWIFTLREGVRWTDGKPVTTDDVEFALKAIFTEGVDNSARDLLKFEGKPVTWQKVDSRTIRFTTPTPVGLFLRLVGAIDVVPKHKLEGALAKGAAEFNRTWGINTPPKELVGTGPYVLQSFVPGQRVTMLRNPTYWKVDKKGNRLPYLTRYIILTVPNLETSRLKFLAKETDQYSARPREFAEFKQGEKAGNYTIYDGPEGFGASFLILNQNPAGVSPPKLTWFQDVRFRRALNHAIDRNTMVQQLFAGRATPAWGPVSIGNKLYHNPNLSQYLYDLNRAQQLLAEAGYRKGADGMLRDAQGNLIEITLSTVLGSSDFEAIGNLIRQDFTKLGIRVNFAPESFPSLVGKLTGTYKWEAIIIALSGGVEPGTGRNVWLSSGDLHMWYPNQDKPATDWEADIDRLFEQIAREVDQNKRRALYFRWQEIVASQVPVMYFAWPKTQPAVRNTVGNIKPGLGGAIGEMDTLYFKGTYR